MTVYKTIFTITVLSEDSPVHTDAEIGDVLREMEQGEFLGGVEYTSSVEVPAEAVEAECEAVGNDGSYFMNDDESFREDDDE